MERDANDAAAGFWLAATLHGVRSEDPDGADHSSEAGALLEAMTAEAREALVRERPPGERQAHLAWVRRTAARLSERADVGYGLGVDAASISAIPRIARVLLAGDVSPAMGQRFIDEAPPRRDGARDPRLIAWVRACALAARATPQKSRD